jgi:hypothetical protein
VGDDVIFIVIAKGAPDVTEVTSLTQPLASLFTLVVQNSCLPGGKSPEMSTGKDKELTGLLYKDTFSIASVVCTTSND